MPVQDNRLENIIDNISEGNSFERIYVLENIPNQLDAFEKRLLNDYSTRDILPETELKLPTLLIDSFSRIFYLWNNNPVFKNSIQSHMFYNIFSLMFRSLNEESTTTNEQIEDGANLSNLTGICDICDEEFEIIHGEAEKSFADHMRSETHINTLNLLNKIGVSDNIDEELEQSVIKQSLEGNSEKHKPVEADGVLKENIHFLRLRDENSYDFECCLCDTVCDEQDDLIDHCNSELHNIRKSYFLRKAEVPFKENIKWNDDLIFHKKSKFYCALCQCIQNRSTVNQHIKGAHHKAWKSFARQVSNLEEPYMFRMSQTSDICFCELCVTKFSLANGITSHCQTENHIELKHFADEIQFLKPK